MTDTFQQLAIAELEPSKDNLRHKVGDVTELAASLKAIGMAQPIIAVANGNGKHKVIAGHRRLAAAKKAGLTDVPVIVKDALTDEERAEYMIVENIQREDLTPVEEAEGYQRLVDAGWSQRKIAERVGRPQGHISKRLSLLVLPKSAKAALDSQGITIGEALELTKLAEHPAHVDTIVAATVKAAKQGHYINVERDVANALANIKREEKFESLNAMAQSTGFKIVKPVQLHGYGQWGPPKGMARIDQLAGVGEAGHKKLDCHALMILKHNYGEPELVAVCTKPRNHPKPKGEKKKASTSSDPNVARRKLKKERTKERAPFFETVVRAKHARADVLVWITDRLVDDASNDVCKIACEGLAIDAGNGYGAHKDALRRQLKISESRRVQIAMAVSLAHGEEGARSTWSTPDKRYMQILKEYGYKGTKEG